MPPSSTNAFFERSSPYAEELIKHLHPYSTPRMARKGEILATAEGNCFLILKGRIAIYRAYDEKLMVVGEGPAIFGLSNVTPVVVECYCKTLAPCQLGIIPSETALEVIRNHNLWELVASHQAYICNRLYTYITHIAAPTAYELIRIQLIQLMAEKDDFRESVVVEKYIRDKTFLSRSGIMRILSDLKAGEYIEMQDGKLIKINKLPEKY
ncbi:TPA: helix-turn-helix domain-containing protein [Klebsiella aerogenes]|nr:helix-turn-helix domain-containing protein [Klebsiella aerogenes]